MLALVVVLVLMQSERDFWPDHLFLMMVIGAAAVWYLRDARLAVGAAAIALATCWLDLGPPVGPNPLRSMVAAPEPPEGATLGEQQIRKWVKFRREQQADAQRRLYTYVVLNAGAFLGLLALAEWKRRREHEEPDRSRSGRAGAPLVLALEERGHAGFGVPRRKRRSPEGRGLMGSYVLALPLMAMLCGVYAFPFRSFEVDGIILVVVIGAAAVWYLREPRLAASAIAFAVFTWALDPSLPDSLVGPLQYVGVPKWISQATPPANANRPPPSLPGSGTRSSSSMTFPLLEALDFKWQQRRLMTNKEAQDQLDRFLVLNGVWFTLLASVSATRRLSRSLEEEREARDAARREKARLARSRI